MPKGSKELCFEDLKQRILTMELAPGSDLDEVSVSDQYGISRTPLREVLQRLSGEGFVTIESNRGAKVASMDIATMRTFFQTAPMIYANIARLASENRRSSQLEKLKGIQVQFSKAIRSENAAQAAIHNHAFHATIGEMAHNAYLVACLDRLLIDHTRLSQTFYRPAEPDGFQRVKRAEEQHDMMISAIEGQDAAMALDVTLKHWDLSRDRIERFVRPDPLPVDVVSLKDHRNAV